jgi:phenylpropionate dioxygenase-like ring-hydroxylating dioxygenase large terminal subunit
MNWGRGHETVGERAWCVVAQNSFLEELNFTRFDVARSPCCLVRG